MTQISANKKNEFLFSLCRFRKDCHYPPICVDFTPLKRYPFIILRPNLTFQSISPTFNKDQNYYTPAFINPY